MCLFPETLLRFRANSHINSFNNELFYRLKKSSEQQLYIFRICVFILTFLYIFMKRYPFLVIKLIHQKMSKRICVLEIFVCSRLVTFSELI